MACLVVLPTYNERDNLPVVVGRLREELPESDILVVDDASPDGTGQLADRMAASDSRVHVLHRPGKQGLGRAYIDGFRWGLERGYDKLVQMDADLSHDPAAVPGLLAALERADLAIGSRYIPGGAVVDWGWSRRVLSRFGGWYARLWLGLPVRDPTGGFKAWKAGLLRDICFESVEAAGYAFQVETTYRALEIGAVVREVPIVFRERVRGASKMSWAVVREAMVAVPSLRWKDFDGQAPTA